MTDAEAEQMLKDLSVHFKQPVLPIGRYCAALRTWQDAVGDRARRAREALYPGIFGRDRAAADVAYARYVAENSDTKAETLGDDDFNRRVPVGEMRRHEAFADKVHDVFLQISKSNLLARLLYNGEKLRTEMCPEHKGHWSGIEWPGNTCPHRCQFTGWIQESDDVGKPLPGVRIMVSK